MAANPNPQPPTTQPYPAFHSSAAHAKQPLHAPFANDPYAASRRDPFLPTTSHHARHGSQGMNGADNLPGTQAERQGGWTHTASNYANHHGLHHHQQSQSGPPPPPAMSSSSNPPGPSPYGYDAARSASLNGANPPNPYGGTAPLPRAHLCPKLIPDSPVAPTHDAPPPPSFARNQMPPPSSPPQHPASASQSQRAPYNAPFGSNRELPGIASMHRPGSSMSISNLIGGGDAGALAQTTQSQPSPPTAAHASSGHNMQPPSPRHSLSSGQRADFAPFRRQASPDRSAYGSNTSRALDTHGFSAGSPKRSHNSHGSLDLGRQSLPPAGQPYRYGGNRLYGPPNDAVLARESQQPATGVPPRPNSQPMGASGPTEEGRSLYDTFSGRRTAYGAPEERRRTLGESHHSRPNAAELLAGVTQGASIKDRPNTVHPVSQSAFSPPLDHRNAPDQNDPSRSTWRHSAPSDIPRAAIDSRREDPVTTQRPYGPLPSPSHSTRIDDQNAQFMVRQRSIDRLNRVAEPYHVAPTSDPNSMERHKTEPLARSISSGGRSLHDYPRRMGEDMQLSKSHIGFGLEASRRTGRASPLPQAVQGAQAQPMLTGKDPGIKSEFGRMFSGLGSGIGSSTPTRGSPMPQNGSFSHDHENGDMLRLQRVNSQQGRKPKRMKDEDVFDADVVDGRGTPSGLRGAKRSKQTHPGHHHHHAAHHHHHHHHHHHKPDDEPSLPSTSTAINGRQPSLTQPSIGQPVHHHHHAQGTPHHHHHHHAPRSNVQAPLPLPRVAVKIHDIQNILDEAAKRPRRHLGSHLYEATTELPKPNSSLDDQFGYSSKPKRLPRFEKNPVNCTFTIRVPRFFLKPRQRQHIVLERHLWGARVYRDDSDPIAAAIHSGWIRGEWDDTVDVSMLDPRITAANEPTDAEDTLLKPPAAPVTPPADMDLHIEILILPQLAEYTGSVEYGISSRKGKGNESLSFMINKIRWVEEGVGSRGQERTAAALKRRLDASSTLLALKRGVDGPMAANSTTRLHA